MLKQIRLDDKNLTVYTDLIFSNAFESYTYLAEYNGEQKIVKIFKDNSKVKNKIQKIILLKERLQNFNYVVTADSFITSDGVIIGYMMPYIKGENLYLPCIKDKKYCLEFLKTLSQKLKRLHDLNIVNADFNNNVIVNDSGMYLIDHDNFAIDNYPVDVKNIFLLEYQKHIKRFDKRFDNYLLNLYTISTLKNTNLSYLYYSYYAEPFKYNFKDEEITEIFRKTMNLDKLYNEELIIDKINSSKELKKIKTKLF